MRGVKTLAATLMVVGLCSRVALAYYVNPPGCNGNTDFTHQTWEFNTDDVPLVADDTEYPYSNPFGEPTFTEVFLVNPTYMFWDPDAMGYAIGRYGMWGGMPFGAAPDETAIAMTFAVPNADRPAPWFKELWIQVAYWGSISEGGQVLTVEIARDAAFDDVYLTYDAVADDIEDISTSGAGSTGQFWRFTHALGLDDQPAMEYVRVSLVPADSAAVFIDQVSIDTRCRTGDFDDDADVDLDDHAVFAGCLSGPGVTMPPPTCSAQQFDWTDLDQDDDVDLDDFAVFQRVMTE